MAMSAYVQTLNRSLSTFQPAHERLSLKQRFTEWYEALPAFTRQRAFSMSELEGALETQGKYLGTILVSLGWKRRRIYSGTGPYHRVWMPPVM